MAFDQNGKWVNEATPQPGTPWRQGYQAPNVAPQEPITASVPIAEVNGRVTPTGDVNGLYSIYGRKNPYESAMQQPGGTGINFAAPVAAFLSGRFEAKRNQEIEAWDKIKADKEKRKENAEIFDKEVVPMIVDTFNKKYSEALKQTNGDQLKAAQIAGPAAAEAGNQESGRRGLGVPKMINFTPFKDGVFAGVWEDSSKSVVQGMIKDGKVGKKKGNDFVPADEKDMLFSDYNKLQDEKAKMARIGAKTLRDFDNADIQAQIRGFQSMKANDIQLSPEEEAQYTALIGEFNRRTNVKPAAVDKSLEPAPQENPGFLANVGNVFSGKLVSPVPGAVVPTQTPSAAPAQAPAAQPAQAAPTGKAQPGDMIAKDGRPIYKLPNGQWAYR